MLGKVVNIHLGISVDELTVDNQTDMVDTGNTSLLVVSVASSILFNWADKQGKSGS